MFGFQQNLGNKDRALRLGVGIAALYLGYMYESYIGGAVGIIMLGTAAIGFCPLYCPLKFSTKQK